MKKITILCLLLCLISRAFAGSHNNTGGKNSQNDCSVTITVNTSWSSICPGGSVTITASGGATYSWNDGETTATITVSPGSSTLYMVTGTDTGGCTGTASSMVNVDNFTVAEGYAYSESCDGLPIIFNSTVTGGISPFAYYWQADGSAGAGDTITNYSSSANDYSLSVTDSLGCHSQAESPYIPRYEFYAYLPDSAQFCNDYGDPKSNTLTPTIVEGRGPYTFSWNTGDTTPTIYPNAPGLYSLIVTDRAGCSQTFNCHVTFPAAPVVTVTASSNNILPGTADTLTSSGAEKYYWSNGMTGNRIIVHPLHTADYSVYGWDTIVAYTGTGSGSGGISGSGGSGGTSATVTTDGCGSPWQGIPLVVFSDPWRPSLSSPFTYTSPIYTLGNVGIGLQVPNYKLEVNGTVAADSTLLIGKVNTGQGIRINGDSATITSPTKTVSFGNDTVVTTGTMKAGGMQVGYFQADSIKTGIINMPDSILKIGDPMTIIIRPCFPVEEQTCAGYEFFGQGFGIPTQLGIGISPHAALHVGCNDNEPYQFLLTEPSSNTNMFSIDRYGNTYVAGNVGIATTQPDAVLSIANPTSPLSYQFSINNSSSDVFTIDKSGNTFAAGNIGIATTQPDAVLSIANPSSPLSYQFSINNSSSDVFTIDKDGNTQDYGSSTIWGSLYVLGQQTTEPIAALRTTADRSPIVDGFQYGLQVLIGNSSSGGGPGTEKCIAVSTSAWVGSYTDLFEVTNFGWVGILTPLPAYPLDVAGTIRAYEIKVCTNGCDFVFDKDYKLMPLKELEEYLNLNHHLPGIASAKEMESSDGIELGKMNTQLLQKVEELTLYTIQLKKQLDNMQEEINKLKENK